MHIRREKRRKGSIDTVANYNKAEKLIELIQREKLAVEALERTDRIDQKMRISKISNFKKSHRLLEEKLKTHTDCYKRTKICLERYRKS